MAGFPFAVLRREDLGEECRGLRALTAILLLFGGGAVDHPDELPEFIESVAESHEHPRQGPAAAGFELLVNGVANHGEDEHPGREGVAEGDGLELPAALRRGIPS